MSREYSAYGKQKKRSNPRGQTTRRKPPSATKNNSSLFWFVSGAAVGGLVTAIILVPSVRPDIPVNIPAESQTANAHEPTWDFIDLLRKDEVVIQHQPVEEATPPAVQQTTQSSQSSQSQSQTEAAATTSADIFLVQAGSFAKQSDADTRRAQLMLINFTNVSIERVQSGGNNRYRVIVGPYNNRRDMTKTLNRISSKGIETLPLKRKK